jgi:hypothetical protein
MYLQRWVIIIFFTTPLGVDLTSYGYVLPATQTSKNKLTTIRLLYNKNHGQI